jgi:hypothetical protein
MGVRQQKISTLRNRILFDQDSRKAWILIRNTGKSLYEDINNFILFSRRGAPRERFSNISKASSAKRRGQSPLVMLVGARVADPDPLDPYVFEPPGSFYPQTKIVRKPLIPTVFVTSFIFEK